MSVGCYGGLLTAEGRVWRQGKSRFTPRHVQATLQSGGGSVTLMATYFIWMQTESGDHV